ncbi:MAG: argininosuccinate lyase [Candidatus Omnitrophota bacterium]|jgi:argininosuccinate lyase
MAKKLWGGRFSHATHAGFEAFSSSLPTDWKLAPYDLRASKVHCQMLVKIKILDKVSGQKIIKGLDKIASRIHAYDEDFRGTEYEDIHSLIESELVRIAGSSAKKIHTARSRNDQVNVATRMYCLDHIAQQIDELTHLQKAILSLAKKNQNIVMPGMTHMQKAQPISVAHWLLSYIEFLDRSKGRLKDAVKRLDVLTLGSGALAGTSIPIDREFVRKKLGFAKLSNNSLDAVGSRDVFAELVSTLALLGTDLSRIAEDLLIYQLEEIDLVQLPEELCTGSSMMPQKRNADFLELMRGSASILIGNSMSSLALLKGVPGSYNRDLQWDKEPLFKSIDLMHQLLTISTDLFRGLKINKDSAKRLIANDQLCATDLAEFLVLKGMPFRTAHEKVGKFVSYCEGESIALKDASEKITQSMLGQSRKDIAKILDTTLSVKFKKSSGSTGTIKVSVQIAQWEKKL